MTRFVGHFYYAYDYLIVLFVIFNALIGNGSIGNGSIGNGSIGNGSIRLHSTKPSSKILQLLILGSVYKTQFKRGIYVSFFNVTN